MSQSYLKNNLKCVRWGALVFAIGYFLVGAYLKSDGPKVDLSKVYELLRDSLTLTAYFLAPAAALVIYSNWRGEHVEKRLESDSEGIIKSIEEAAKEVNNLRNLIEDPVVINSGYASETSMKFETLDFTAHIIKSRLERLEVNSKEQQDFIDKGKNITSLLVESLVLINELIGINGDQIKYREFNPKAKLLNLKLSSLKDELIEMSKLTINFRIRD